MIRRRKVDEVSCFSDYDSDHIAEKTMNSSKCNKSLIRKVASFDSFSFPYHIIHLDESSCFQILKSISDGINN